MLLGLQKEGKENESELRAGRVMIKQPQAGFRLRNLMENPNPPPRKDYAQYIHTDSCSSIRWTSRESYQFMYSRPWQRVNDFYLDVVNGRRSISELFSKETYAVDDGAAIVQDFDKSESMSLRPAKDRKGRWARTTYKIVHSYHGASFDGWQKQPGLNTVQGLIERCVGKFVDEKKMQQLKEKKLPIEACAVVAGRTDKGVTALEQVCSFYTWRTDVKDQDIVESINFAAPGKINVVSVSQVSREFHPNFCAKWRRYFYIFPFDGQNTCTGSNQSMRSVEVNGDSQDSSDEEKSGYMLEDGDKTEQETGEKPTIFNISDVNRSLQQLEGKVLSYRMFARDTKASRNVGPPTECFIFHARAEEAYISCPEDGTTTKIMCIELVANRFLRKMVRVLVATSVREAAAGAGEDALIKLMDATCRRATAPPAPPDGLCLVDVGYSEFDRKRCFIH